MDGVPAESTSGAPDGCPILAVTVDALCVSPAVSQEAAEAWAQAEDYARSSRASAMILPPRSGPP
jgi:hypothetical protein